MPLSPEQVESELLPRAVSGDRIALQSIFIAHHDELLAYVKRLLPRELQSTWSIDDVFQETYVEAQRRICSFEITARASLKAWLKTIARRRMIDHLRSHTSAKRGGQAKARNGDDLGHLAEMLDQLAVYRRTPSKSAAARELTTALDRFVGKLPKDLREAIRLRHAEGLSAREAAARMQRTEAAFHNLCYRGYVELRREMKSRSIYV
jgi:RNA polymerase sigma-70 factor (ECF subfamily)